VTLWAANRVALH